MVTAIPKTNTNLAGFGFEVFACIRRERKCAEAGPLLWPEPGTGGTRQSPKRLPYR
jgi:hypothetical protein